MKNSLAGTWICAVLAAAACSHGSSDQAAGGAAGGGRGKRGGGAGGGSGSKLEYPVDVVKLESRKVQYTVEAPGTIEAFQQVQITARVAGAVDKVTFAEGQTVKAGDTLATIENERYSIAVEQAQATVARANATERSAQAALDRRNSAQAASPGLVPGEEIEQKQTAVDQAKADVDAAKQALRVAQLNLRDSSVRAPIAGVVQTRTVQQGQYLTAGAVLATILQRDPMVLRFQVGEDDAPRIQARMDKAGQLGPAIANVTLNESARTFTATLTLVAGSADPTTRLVPVTGRVDETEHKFWLRPGAFCQVSVPVGETRDSIVVPSLAVAPTENGNIVYIVDDKHIAHAKIVKTGMHTVDGGIELTSGVAAGDLMVVRGIEALSEGAPVKIASTLTAEQAQQPPPDAGVAPVAPVTQLGVGSGSSAPAASAGSGAAP